MAKAASVMPMLSVAALAPTLAFYRDGLGGEIVYQFPANGQAVFVTLRLGETELGFGVLSETPLHGQPQRPAAGHRIELCVYVDDPDFAVKDLAATGARVVMAARDLPWGERAAYVEDPDGNLVMLAAR